MNYRLYLTCNTIDYYQAYHLTSAHYTSINISNRRVAADLRGYRERDRTARERLTRRDSNSRGDSGGDSRGDSRGDGRGDSRGDSGDDNSMLAEEEEDDDNVISIGQDATESLTLDYVYRLNAVHNYSITDLPLQVDLQELQLADQYTDQYIDYLAAEDQVPT